jgi:tetratricopeptide (TPR) repeat protein
MAIFFRTFLPVSILFIIISGCGNNNDGDSPYAELLSQPPYASLTDSIQHNPSNPDLYYHRGILLFKNNNNPPALADFRKAWSMEKKEIYALDISNVLLTEKPDSAIAFLKDALKLLPSSIPLHINLIQAYANVQKTDEALALCNFILKQHPDHVGILMMKADLQEQKNDTIGSMNTLEQAYRFAPANEDLCYNLAFKFAQNKNSKVLTLCDSLLQNDALGKNAEPYYFKGVYYSNINDRASALTYFNKAIAADYTFLDAYMDKGRILFNEKKYNDAVTDLQLALKISPAYADAYYWLGKCQEMLGQKQDAKLNYQRAFGLDKTLTEAKEAADKL